MAIKIPKGFDVNAEALDPNEVFIRDHQKLNITNWAKFRHTIGVGNNANRLSSPNPIPEAVEGAYRELAKSHYEVITSLGAARLSYDIHVSSSHVNPLMFKKSTKDFYFHLGCLLDNLARIIYILNSKNGATETLKNGRFRRHWIDWGGIRNTWHPRLRASKQLRGIINIRNVFVHGWSPPTMINATNMKDVQWPLALRSSRDFYWPYDERRTLTRKYRKWVPVINMMRDDLEFIERFQNKVFAILVKDVRTFERTYGLVIR